MITTSPYLRLAPALTACVVWLGHPLNVAALGAMEPPHCALYEENRDRVWAAVVHTLESGGELLQERNRSEGVIETAFRVVDVETSTDMADVTGGDGEWLPKRRYRLRLVVSGVAPSATTVTVKTAVFGWMVLRGVGGRDQPAPMPPANWFQVPSNGRLEEVIFRGIAQRVQVPTKACAHP